MNSISWIRHIHFDIQSNSKDSRYLLTEERRSEVRDSLGFAALYLLEFYLRKAGHSTFTFEDGATARATGLPIKTIQNARLKLQKAGWFLSIKDRKKHEHSVYVGQRFVARKLKIASQLKEAKQETKLAVKEAKDLGDILLHWIVP